jgi:hypothetical protein
VESYARKKSCEVCDKEVWSMVFQCSVPLKSSMSESKEVISITYS